MVQNPDVGVVAHESTGSFSQRLLAWYDKHHRDLPWRVSPIERKKGIEPDPYRVWLSEIMLQQTTVATVRSYYQKFIERWPTIDALAAAETDDVMKMWAGLGYYSRARNLKKCAGQVSEKLGGRFPSLEGQLKQLPGIGDYTAAAISAIAFDKPSAVVDGNIERVISRHNAVETALPKAKAEIRSIVRALVPPERSGDFAQALMDLGAMICTPKRPTCSFCPLNETCAAIKIGDPERFPAKAPKSKKPTRRTAAFVALAHDGSIYLQKRPNEGLLGGMSEVPNGGFSSREDGDRSLEAAPFSGDWALAGKATHIFTHFKLELDVYRTDMSKSQNSADGWWSKPEDVSNEALPTVMRKVLAAAGVKLKKAV